MKPWHEPQPESGYVVDIHFYNSDEVLSIPFKGHHAANREALKACAEAAVPRVLGVFSVAIYSPDLVRHALAARLAARMRLAAGNADI